MCGSTHLGRLRTDRAAPSVIDTLDVRCRVSSWQHSIPDHNIIFDALEGSAAVRKAKGALSLPAAGRYLNAPSVQIGLLAFF